MGNFLREILYSWQSPAKRLTGLDLKKVHESLIWRGWSLGRIQEARRTYENALLELARNERSQLIFWNDDAETFAAAHAEDTAKFVDDCQWALGCVPRKDQLKRQTTSSGPPPSARKVVKRPVGSQPKRREDDEVDVDLEPVGDLIENLLAPTSTPPPEPERSHVSPPVHTHPSPSHELERTTGDWLHQAPTSHTSPSWSLSHYSAPSHQETHHPPAHHNNHHHDTHTNSHHTTHHDTHHDSGGGGYDGGGGGSD